MNKKILVGLCALFILPSMAGAVGLATPSKEYSTPDRSQVPAFPGADGAGKYATGGAGGTVYTVTSLADDGSEGTFRWAINKKGPRTIIFAVITETFKAQQWRCDNRRSNSSRRRYLSEELYILHSSRQCDCPLYPFTHGSGHQAKR